MGDVASFILLLAAVLIGLALLCKRSEVERPHPETERPCVMGPVRAIGLGLKLADDRLAPRELAELAELLYIASGSMRRQAQILECDGLRGDEYYALDGAARAASMAGNDIVRLMNRRYAGDLAAVGSADTPVR